MKNITDKYSRQIYSKIVEDKITYYTEGIEISYKLPGPSFDQILLTFEGMITEEAINNCPELFKPISETEKIDKLIDLQNQLEEIKKQIDRFMIEKSK